MNILWIPHSPLLPGVHRRDQYLIAHLRKKHRIYTLTWETWSRGKQLDAFFKGLHFFPLDIDGYDAFHIRRIPDVLKPFRQKKHSTSGINQHFFRQDIERIVRRCPIDMIVTGPTSYMTGYPSFDLNIPLVFDYLDCADWALQPHHPEKTYLGGADAVLCVSTIAQDRARAFNKPNVYLPNGADVQSMQSASGQSVRAYWGIHDAPLISLIGFTCSPRLYFLDAVLQAKKNIPALKCLLVGHSPAIQEALSRIPNAEDTFIYTGPVPYKEIASFFAASDVGMYPVDETTYYSAASPIKIFEYTAAGKPVVTPHLTELLHLGFPNLVFASPEINDFAAGIEQAFKRPTHPLPDIHDYDWAILAEKLDQFLTQVAADFTPTRKVEPPIGDPYPAPLSIY